jgi:hypothetical protein
MTPAGKYLVTGNTSSSDLTVLRSSGTGELGSIAGSPFASPFYVRELAFVSAQIWFLLTRPAVANRHSG